MFGLRTRSDIGAGSPGWNDFLGMSTLIYFNPHCYGYLQVLLSVQLCGEHNVVSRMHHPSVPLNQLQASPITKFSRLSPWKSRQKLGFSNVYWTDWRYEPHCEQRRQPEGHKVCVLHMSCISWLGVLPLAADTSCTPAWDFSHVLWQWWMLIGSTYLGLLRRETKIPSEWYISFLSHTFYSNTPQ